MCIINKQTGFTLLEMLIVVAVMSMLAIVAIPSYQSYIIKARMKEASQVMMKDAQFMEKYYIQNGRYTTAGNAWPTLPYLTSPESGTALYRITISNNPDSSEYRLQGRPICGTVVASSGCVCLDQDNNVYLAQDKICFSQVTDCTCTN